MLAVQQPVFAHRPGDMVSQEPRDANGMLFGYDLNPEQAFLFTNPPPEPAPGPPLLSDIELRQTNDWFQNIDAGNFNSFADGGEGLNFTDDWLLLPPQYVGSTTSFGQPTNALPDTSPHSFAQSSFLHNGATPSSSSMAPPPLLPQQNQRSFEQEYSADVLAAATTLSQNGAMSHLNNGNHGAWSTPSSISNLAHRPLNGAQHSVRRLSGQPVPEESYNLFVNMLNGQGSSRRSKSLKRPDEIKWGTDVSFGGNNFTPRSEKETSQALEQERLTTIACLELNKSAANTRPSSPVQSLQSTLKSPLKLKTREPAIAVKEDPDGPARKRRKSKATNTDYASDDSSSNKTGSRRKRNPSDGGMGSASPPPAGQSSHGKRRKSSGKAALTKTARENLSEEQKRENHIKSEQKRRTLIKQGFIDMEALVPGMKGGGFSKATMLTMATEWLEEMMRGNDQLKQQLRSLGVE